MKIKFITLNVEHGGKLMDNILSFLDEKKPDILFLQEVYNSHDKSLEKRFRTFEIISDKVSEFMPFYDFKGLAYDPDVKAELGNAIFSKYKIINSGNYFFDVPYKNVTFAGEHDPFFVPRALQHVVIHTENDEMNLFNIHGIWGHDGKDNARRIKMGSDIAKIIKDRPNVILAGDTNFTVEAVNTIRLIEGAGVKSVFGDSLVSTFNMLHKELPGYAASAVDMIFVSKNIKIIEKSLLKADISDHYPLKVVIEV